MIWHSWDPICRGVAFEFLCSPEVICGNTGKVVLFLQNKRKPAATRKPKHKNTQTNNKTRKPNRKYTNKTIKTYVSRHNLVVLIMGVCTIGLKVWNKDGYRRREYIQRELYYLKLKWAIGKMKWYTVDIKNSYFSTILSVIIGRDKYISVLFFKCELRAVMKRGINLVGLRA